MIDWTDIESRLLSGDINVVIGALTDAVVELESLDMTNPNTSVLVRYANGLFKRCVEQYDRNIETDPILYMACIVLAIYRKVQAVDGDVIAHRHIDQFVSTFSLAYSPPVAHLALFKAFSVDDPNDFANASKHFMAILKDKRYMDAANAVAVEMGVIPSEPDRFSDDGEPLYQWEGIAGRLDIPDRDSMQ